MDPKTLSSVAESCQATIVHGDPTATIGPDVVIDSRQATSGALFVALAGEHVDGRDYVTAARLAGAGAAIVSSPVDDPLPQLLSKDPALSLAEIARAVVSDARLAGLTTVALTGSSGKTSTKDIIAQLLESVGPTVSPEGSFNNEIGVPLTACKVTTDTRFLVSEMGARGLGHLSWLVSIVPADIAVVLNVGSAHVGEFGSLETIATAKAEILRDGSEHSWAVLNDSDSRVAAMAAGTPRRKAWFSADGRPTHSGDITVWASSVTIDERARPHFTLHIADDSGEASAPVSLLTSGNHGVANATAAAAVGAVVGMNVNQLAAQLSQATARSRWRMELTERSDGVVIVNDSYNANPDSMKAGLQTLHELGVAQQQHYPDARTIAVLGEMRELGDTAAEEHRKLGHLAAELSIDRLICVGSLREQIAEGALAGQARVQHIDQVADKNDVVALLAADLKPGDLVFIKASRAAELETVAADLLRGAGE